MRCWKASIHFQNYKDALFTDGKEQQLASMNCIRSKNHNLVSIKINKIGKNQTTINGQRFVYGQILNSASSDNYKTVLINKYTKQTALFFRKIVLE